MTAATHTSAVPRVLTIGAYERDNFGDLLFLLLTERYLGGAEVIAAAPFAADMTPLLGRQVSSYGPLLAEGDVDVVWTVGGEVGGSTLNSAYRMTAAPADYARYQALSPAEKREHVQSLVSARVGSAYLPSLASFPRNAGALAVVNSVGLTKAAKRVPHDRAELVATLDSADAVTVRDRESSELLTSLGIEHRLVPDLVHALGAVYPFERDPRSRTAVVQASTSILNKLGHEAFADQLVASKHLRGLRLSLVLAGTATGHDSFDDLERVAARIRTQSRRAKVEVVADRRPLDLVGHIRRARVVVGTSLHVRIVASAYGVPRVSLSRAKVNRYARSWDRLMPFNVALGDLGPAIGAAIDAGRRPEAREAAQELTRMADDNVRGIADRVLELARTRTPADRAERARVRLADVEAARALEADGVA